MERGSYIYLGGGGAIPVTSSAPEVRELAISTHGPWLELELIDAAGNHQPIWIRPEEIKAVAPGRLLNPSQQED